MTATNHGRLANNQVGQLVRAPKTSELIAAQLRRQIVRGAVKPGEKLPPETQLMEQFGVSRPTPRAPSACGAATWTRPRPTCSRTTCWTSRW